MNTHFKISSNSPSKTIITNSPAQLYWAIFASIILGSAGLMLFLFAGSEDLSNGGHVMSAFFAVFGLLVIPLFMLGQNRGMLRQIVFNHQAQNIEFWCSGSQEVVTQPYAEMDFFISEELYRNQKTYYILSLQRKDGMKWRLDHFEVLDQAKEFENQLRQYWPATPAPSPKSQVQDLQLSQKNPRVQQEGKELLIRWRNNPLNLGVFMLFSFCFGLLGIGLHLGFQGHWADAGPFLAIGGLFSTIATVSLIKELFKTHRLILNPEGLHYYQNQKLEQHAPLSSIAAVQLVGLQMQVHTVEQLKRVEQFAPQNWENLVQLLGGGLNPLNQFKLLHPLGWLHELKRMYQLGKGISVQGLSKELSELLASIQHDWKMELWDLTAVNSIRLELRIQEHLRQLREMSPVQ